MQSKIEQQVMAGVGVIYGARLVLSATALKLYAFAVAAYALVQFTWVHKVFANWAHVGLAGTWQFVTYAVMHTHLPVQIALAILAVMGLWLIRDAVRSVTATSPVFA